MHVPPGGRKRRLFDETLHHVHPRPARGPRCPAGLDVSQSRFRIGRPDAHEADGLRVRGDDAPHRVEPFQEPVLLANVVVRRQRDDDLARGLFGDGIGDVSDGRRRPLPVRLDKEMLPRESGELMHHGRKMRAAGAHEDIAFRKTFAQPLDRLLEKGLFAEERLGLFWRARTRHRPQPSPDPPCKDDYFHEKKDCAALCAWPRRRKYATFCEVAAHPSRMRPLYEKIIYMFAKVKAFLFENQTTRQTVAKNTIWLAVSNFGGRFIRAFIIIYAARVLGPAEWGVFSYVITIVAFLTIFVDSGINPVVIRDRAQSTNADERRTATVTAFAVKLAFVAIGIPLIALVAPLLP